MEGFKFFELPLRMRSLAEKAVLLFSHLWVSLMACMGNREFRASSN